MEKIIITEEQIKLLRPYIKNIDDLIMTDLETLLDAINDVIIEYIYKKDNIMIKGLQRIYDDIFYANE